MKLNSFKQLLLFFYWFFFIDFLAVGVAVVIVKQPTPFSLAISTVWRESVNIKGNLSTLAVAVLKISVQCFLDKHNNQFVKQSLQISKLQLNKRVLYDTIYCYCTSHSDPVGHLRDSTITILNLLKLFVYKLITWL